MGGYALLLTGNYPSARPCLQCEGFHLSQANIPDSKSHYEKNHKIEMSEWVVTFFRKLTRVTSYNQKFCA